MAFVGWLHDKGHAQGRDPEGHWQECCAGIARLPNNYGDGIMASSISPTLFDLVRGDMTTDDGIFRSATLTATLDDARDRGLIKQATRTVGDALWDYNTLLDLERGKYEEEYPDYPYTVLECLDLKGDDMETLKNPPSGYPGREGPHFPPNAENPLTYEDLANIQKCMKTYKVEYTLR